MVIKIAGLISFLGGFLGHAPLYGRITTTWLDTAETNLKLKLRGFGPNPGSLISLKRHSDSLFSSQTNSALNETKLWCENVSLMSWPGG